MTVVANRCAALLTMINTGPDGGAPSHGPTGNPLPLRQRRAVTEQLNPAGLSYTYQYEKDRITITDSLDRREVLHTQGEARLKRVVKKEHADGSVTQSQFDAGAGSGHRRMPQAGQQSTARMW